MTQQFISLCRIDETACTETTYDKIDVLESAMDCFGDGILDSRVANTAVAYTHSIIDELLDNAKAFLLQLVQRVLSLFNNFYLNGVKVANKYAEFIVNNFPAELKLQHETYEYPMDRGYPRNIRSDAIAERDIIRIKNKIATEDCAPDEIALMVDNQLRVFGRQVLWVSPDLDQLKESVQKIVTQHVRGKMVNEEINKATVKKYLEQISHYKSDHDEIQAVRKAIITDYETLKKQYKSMVKDARDVTLGRYADSSDPRRREMVSREYNRYADINVQMMRLFNGYITIYKTAFDTKLVELQNKIQDRRNLITEIMTRSRVFATLNVKDPNDLRKPIPFDGALKT